MTAATGAAIFHGAYLGRGSEVRVHATVHLRTRLEPGAVVPIGWVAVGDPASILPPDRHEEIWAVQAPLKPLNVQPAAGTAVSSTTVPSTYVARSGFRVTVPLPTTFVVSAYSSCTNVALLVR